MKKRQISVCLAGLMLAGMLSGCSEYHDNGDLAQIAALQQENAQLAAAVNSLKADLRALQCTSLEAWKLTAEPMEDGSGATARFEAQTVGVKNGQSVHFIVMLGDKTIVDLPCAPDGSRFTASAQLDAQNGYTFYCDLSDGSSEPVRYALLNPQDIQLSMLMNLQDSLSTYATMLVNSWKVEEEVLHISADVQIQLSNLRKDEKPAEVESAKLYFTMGGETIQAIDIVVESGSSSLSSLIEDVTCPVPEDMEADAQLTLNCEIKLADGTVLTADGGSWFLQDEQLQMVAG